MFQETVFFHPLKYKVKLLYVSLRSVKGGSNSRPSAWEADALPTELLAHMTWVTSPWSWLVGPGMRFMVLLSTTNAPCSNVNSGLIVIILMCADDFCTGSHPNMSTSFILIVHMHMDDLLGIPDPLSCLLAPPLGPRKSIPQTARHSSDEDVYVLFMSWGCFPTKAWTQSQRTDIGATSPGLLLFSLIIEKQLLCVPLAPNLYL